MSATGNVSPAKARRLIRNAFASGVGFCGVSLMHGRPKIGCGLGASQRAHEMLCRVIEAERRDPAAINRALWNHVMRFSPEWSEEARVVVMLSGGEGVRQ